MRTSKWCAYNIVIPAMPPYDERFIIKKGIFCKIYSLWKEQERSRNSFFIISVKVGKYPFVDFPPDKFSEIRLYFFNEIAYNEVSEKSKVVEIYNEE